ncbi:MAG: hypothetical protein N838_27965 [Thiohalocapsa sp. PB-PSB1]|jgi:hypothetical protein|nr:MAG: hypothetical protein N838_27965 [Thiohalocapsa sp. PB-PSB1]
MRLAALVQTEEGLWQEPDYGDCPLPSATADSVSGAYRQCSNYAHYDVCNWMVPAHTDQAFCAACRPNQVIPNLDRPGNLDKWYRIERAKRRLIYALLNLGLPMQTRDLNPSGGLGFAFLSKLDAAPGEIVTTGHANGLITINIDEADPSLRERMRLDMDEKYRTLVGHWRHEIGHYFWDVLIRDGGRLDSFRALFGDEQVSYSQALDEHYEKGAPADWQDAFISSYAASHPWEDWAETWAHYLHIVDTLETGEHFGIAIERRMPDGTVQRAEPDYDPYDTEQFQPIIDDWLPLTFALNSINRSMGLADLYPFVLWQPVIDKLAFIHRVVRQSRIATG